MGNSDQLFNRNSREESDDSGLFPIMSMMMILVPVLVSNLAFYHIKSVKAVTPGTSPPDVQEPQKKSNELQVIGQVKILEDKVSFDLINEDTGDVISNTTIAKEKSAYRELQNKLVEVKENYKKFDSLMVSVFEKESYEQMITLLDLMKAPGKIGQEQVSLNLVIIPKGGL